MYCSANGEMDERQMFLRGKAFFHALIIAVILIFADGFFRDDGINLVQGMWGNNLLVVLITAVIFTELLLKNAFDFDSRRGMAVLTLLGVVGGVLLVWGVGDVLRDGFGFGAGYLIPKSIAELAMAAGWLWIGVLYWVKVGRAKKEA